MLVLSIILLPEELQEPFAGLQKSVQLLPELLTSSHKWCVYIQQGIRNAGPSSHPPPRHMAAAPPPGRIGRPSGSSSPRWRGSPSWKGQTRESSSRERRQQSDLPLLSAHPFQSTPHNVDGGDWNEQRERVKPTTSAGGPSLTSPFTIQHFLEPFYCSAEGFPRLEVITGCVLQRDKRKGKQWRQWAVTFTPRGLDRDRWSPITR